MSNYNHQLFLQETISLLRSVVLKSEYSALSINQYLALKHGVSAFDEADKTTWKYYLNLAGQRHATDPQIQVKSMDTQALIDFTPANLAVHVATARAYQPGTQKYKELLVSYPGQEVLVHGILFPVDIQKAIRAADFTILNYSREYVEVNEEHLIAGLQDWIYGMRGRFYVQAMDLVEELYTPTFLGVLFTLMPQVIINLRQAAMKTDRAHSFHVRSYLASHNRLDKFYDHLTTEQKFFFYKNIRYLQRNTGQTDTFQWLHQEVLTKRNLPLAEYTAEQVYTAQSTPENTTLLPTVAFFSKALSRVPSLAAASVSASQMLAKEVSLAPGNPEEALFASPQMEADVAYAGISSLRTKVLESSVLQTSEGSSRTVQDTALSLWAMAAASNRYTTFVYFADPVSGEQIGLSALNAYYYFQYAFFQAMGVQLKEIPPVIALEAPIWPKPDFDALYGSVNRDSMSVEFARQLYDRQPIQRSFANNDAFHGFVTQQSSALNDLYLLAAYPEDMIGRASAMRIVEALNYTQLIHRPEEGTSYQDFVLDNGLPASGLSQEQWKALYSEIFEKATGQEITQIQAQSATQSAMVRLMSHLSSYSVQFVSQISGSQLTSLRWSAIRFGQSIEKGGMVYNASVTPLKILSEHPTSRNYYRINIPNMLLRFSVLSSPKKVEFLNLGMKMRSLSSSGLGAAPLKFGLSLLNTVKEGVEEVNSIEDIAWIDPMPSTVELSQLNDHYASLCKRFPQLPTKIDFAEFVRSERINSFYVDQGINKILRNWQSFAVARHLRYFGTDLTIVVLDAFEAVFGDINPEVFEAVPRTQLLDLFHYIAPLAEDPYDVFQYAGAPVVAGSFRPGQTPGDFVAGTVKLRESSNRLTGAPRFSTTDQIPFLHRGSRISFNFRLGVPTYVLRYQLGGRNIQVNFKKGFGNINTGFYLRGDPVRAGKIIFRHLQVAPNVSFKMGPSNFRLPKPIYGSAVIQAKMKLYGNTSTSTLAMKGYMSKVQTTYRGTLVVPGAYDAPTT